MDKEMDKEMINIDTNLLKEPTFGTFTRGDNELKMERHIRILWLCL